MGGQRKNIDGSVGEKEVEGDKMKEHNWDKKNLVGQRDQYGQYDLWYCTDCYVEYKRRSLAWNPPTDECKGDLRRG